MKNLLVPVIILTLLLLNSYSNAQIKVGIIGGINIASFHVNDDEISSRVLWGSGLIVNYGLSRYFSLQAEPIFLKKGGVKEQHELDPKLTLFQNFIEIPLLLNFNYGEISKIHLLAGPTIGFLLSSEMEVPLGDVVFEADLMDLTEKIDFGLCLGVGFSTEVSPGTLFAEIKYTLGLTNLAKTGTFTAKAGRLEVKGAFDAEESWYKSRGIQLFVGYKISI